MPQIVPLTATPNQELTVGLGGQSCQIAVYQKSRGLFFDLYVNDKIVVVGVLCLNKTRIVRDLYFGFSGDFAFNDTQGDESPDYTGLGGRFELVYIPASELPPGVG